MAKKDKAAKAAKRQRGLEKSLKNQKKSVSKAKKLNAKLGEEDVDVEAMLAEMAQQQADFEKVEIAVCQRPEKRQNAALVASPTNSRELLLFGGEILTKEGQAQFYNELYVYNTHSNVWRSVKSGNAPLARSSHAMCAHPSGIVVLHGGEFSSPKQTSFHHYGDTWVLDTQSKEWTKIESRKPSPKPRSGHRMCVWKNYILLFGGFRDLSDSTQYLSDLWAFDVTDYEWTKLEFPNTVSTPEARSGHSLLPTNEGAVLLGGYTKVKATRGQQKGKVLQDSWILHMKSDLDGVRWERRKRGSYAPSPRIGYQLAPHRLGTGKGVMFGGVFDLEETEESLKSQFFNNLYSYHSETNRWYELRQRKSRAQKADVKSKPHHQTRAQQADLEHNLSQILQSLNIDMSEMIDDEDEAGNKNNENGDDKEEEIGENAVELSIRQNPPPARFNAATCVQNDVFYIYCGQYEEEDTEYTFDSFYSVDLGKLNGFTVIWEEELVINRDTSEDEEDDEDDDEEEDEDEAEANKAASEVLVAEETEETEEIEEGESDETDLRPWLPQPVPFESISQFYRKHLDVFVQYAFHDEPEARGKDLKKFAFEMCRDRWWERREVVQNAEDELEGLGVEDVVNKNRSSRR